MTSRWRLIALLVIVVAAGAYYALSGGSDSTPVSAERATTPFVAQAPRAATQIGAPAANSKPSTMDNLRGCLKSQGFSAHRKDATHVRVRSGDFGPIVVRLFPTIAEAKAAATPEMTAPISDLSDPPNWILANNALIHGMVFVGFSNEREAFGACLTRAG